MKRMKFRARHISYLPLKLANRNSTKSDLRTLSAAFSIAIRSNPLEVAVAAHACAEAADNVVEARFHLRDRIVARLPRLVAELYPGDVLEEEAAPRAARGEARAAVALELKGQNLLLRAFEADGERRHIAAQ